MYGATYQHKKTNKPCNKSRLLSYCRTTLSETMCRTLSPITCASFVERVVHAIMEIHSNGRVW